jgi:acetyl-CoA carboxylase carboxyl transferase subunit alpha
MLENTWYSVISPESCSSILWRSWNFKEQAAEGLKLTAQDMLQHRLIDAIIKEPLGGAHNNPPEIFETVKQEIITNLAQLTSLPPGERIAQRIKKFCSMGVVLES